MHTDFGRKMTWENVGKEYTTVFHETLNNYIPYPKIRNIVNFLPNKLPEVKVDQLKLLMTTWPLYRTPIWMYRLSIMSTTLMMGSEGFPVIQKKVILT